MKERREQPRYDLQTVSDVTFNLANGKKKFRAVSRDLNAKGIFLYIWKGDASEIHINEHCEVIVHFGESELITRTPAPRIDVHIVGKILRLSQCTDTEGVVGIAILNRFHHVRRPLVSVSEMLAK